MERKLCRLCGITWCTLATFYIEEWQNMPHAFCWKPVICFNLLFLYAGFYHNMGLNSMCWNSRPSCSIYSEKVPAMQTFPFFLSCKKEFILCANIRSLIQCKSKYYTFIDWSHNRNYSYSFLDFFVLFFTQKVVILY